MDHWIDPSWEEARFLLEEYDGMASELFVIDLPISNLDRVVTILSTLPDLEVLSSGEAEIEEPVRFDNQWEQRLRVLPDEEILHLLRSANGTARHLQIYVFVDATSDNLEVEFVFWNDLTFPKNVSESELRARFGNLLKIARECRNGVPGSHCVLSGEHNGDPHELLDAEWTLVW